jgi:quercetin dioxygenase-like cupin family protein
MAANGDERSRSELTMFYQPAGEGYEQALDGVLVKTLVYGDRTLLAEFRIAAGAVIPAHHHPHEQTGYLVSGTLEFTIGDESRIATAGASWSLAPGVEHGAQALEDAVVVEVFSPVREDMLPGED